MGTTDRIKVGDKVRRKPEYRDPTVWKLGDTVLEVASISREGDSLWLHGNDISIGYWDAEKFDKVSLVELLKEDLVNHPAHYNAGAVETIDYIMQVARTYPGDEAVLVGNVLKYVSRATLKGKKAEDLKKAQWYLNRLIDIST